MLLIYEREKAISFNEKGMWSGSGDWRRQQRKRKAPPSDDRRGGGKLSHLGHAIGLSENSATLGPRFWALARTPGAKNASASKTNGVSREHRGVGYVGKRKARAEAQLGIGSPGVFARASKSAIKKRRKVRAGKGKKAREVMTYEHARHMKALNESFGSWVRAADVDGLWIDAAQEYVAFATQIEERYLARAGEVMTFGTGDCGQLGHGVEDYSDTEIKFPRVVSMAKLLPAFGNSELWLCAAVHVSGH